MKHFRQYLVFTPHFMLYLGIFGLRSGQCAYWSYYNPNKFGLLQVLPYFIAVSFYFLPIKFGFKPLTNGILFLVNFSSFRFLQKRRLLNNFEGPWGILFAVLWIRGNSILQLRIRQIRKFNVAVRGSGLAGKCQLLSN